MKKIKFILVLALGLMFLVSCNTTEVTYQKEIETTSKVNVSTELVKEDENEELSNENTTEEMEAEELPFIKSELKLEMQTEILTTDMIQDMEKDIKRFVEGDIVVAEYRGKSMMAPNTQDITKEHIFVFKDNICEGVDGLERYVTWDEFDFQGAYISSGSTKGILQSKKVGYITYCTLDVNGDLNYDLILKVQDMGDGNVDDNSQEVVLVFLAVPGTETGWEYAGCYRADYIDDDELFVRLFFNGLE